MEGKNEGAISMGVFTNVENEGGDYDTVKYS